MHKWKIVSVTITLLSLTLIADTSLAKNKAGSENKRRKISFKNIDGYPIWWNMPKYIEELSLKKDQRKQFDSFLKVYMEQRKKVAEKVKLEKEKLYNALISEDWDAMNLHAYNLNQLNFQNMKYQLDLKSKVYSLLTKKQQETLNKKFKGLLMANWVLSQRFARVKGVASEGGSK